MSVQPELLQIVIHPDYHEQFKEMTVAASGKLESVDWEIRLNTQFTNIEFIRVIARPQATADGDVAWDGLALDITARKQAEESLKQSEYRFGLILEKASDGINIAEYDPKTHRRRLVMCNDRYVEMSGRSREELMAAEDINQFTSVSKAHGQLFHENVLKDLPSEGAASWFRPDGRENYYEWTATPLKMGDKYHIIGIDRDITERRRTEAALRESEETARAFLNASTDLALLIEHDGTIVTVNEVTARTSGRPINELIGANVRDIDNSAKLRLPHADEVIRSGKPSRFEDEHHGRWLDHSVYPVFDAEGMVNRLAIFARDITERKQAEEALRREKNRAQEYLDVAGVLLMAIDADQKIIRINKKGCEVLGYEKEEELIGKHYFNNFIPERLRYEVIRVFELLMAGEVEPAEYFENPVLTKSGEERILAWHNTVLKDEQGKIYAALSSGEDITERKQAEELRRIQHDLAIDLSITSDLTETVDQLLETVFRIESIDCGGVYLVDAHTGDLELVSYKGLSQQFAENASYYSADSPQTRLVMKGEPLYGFYPKLFPSVDETHKQESLRAFATIPVKYEGKVIAVLNLASHIYDAIPDSARDLLEGIAAQIGGVIARVRAENEKTELEAQLRQAVKMEAIGRLAGGIAHDFNNMLAIIQGYADLLLKAMDADDRNRDDVERIRTASKRAAALTRQLLAFGRRQTIRPEVLDLNDIISDTDSMLRRIIGEDIELIIKPGKDLWHVKADPRQIEEQVILNLTVNAREAMPGGGKITIATANIVLDEDDARRYVEVTPGEYVMLTVSDTGTGMTEEVMSHVFEPFFTTKETGESSGLGLSTVYGIIKQCSGHIEAQSTPGRGSTFRLYLPRVRKPLEAYADDPKPDQPAPGAETILVAEDEPLVRDLLCRILCETGYTVLEASDGEKAIHKADDVKKIHLLVTDVVMPHMSGKDLADHVKERHPNIKVLFVSGYTGDSIAHQGILDKGVNFLAKPFTSRQLIRTVRRVFDTD